ncbi:MAG: protein phosphatase [Ilumatobacteraceae bacterium]
MLALPSGRLVRGRGLRHLATPRSADGLAPTFGVYLLGGNPPTTSWESVWIEWPDFRLPRDRSGAAATLRAAWGRLAADRVEVACGGGLGRTGTALAYLAVIDGLPAVDAVRYVRTHYNGHAVETPLQRRSVERFS